MTTPGTEQRTGLDGTAEPGPSDLTLDRVSVRYIGRREPALDELDLAVRGGERVGVAGRTGAGKSTLALVAAGFIPRVVRAKLSGRAAVGTLALDAADGGALLGRVGIVFSTPANQLSASKLTVREELAFGLENLGLPRAEMDARIDAVMARLGIDHLAEREPFALSGGEQQRVAIASIVTMGTSLLVLDEPTAQLDPAGTAAVATLLEDLARDGAAVLCAEHDPTILGRLDRCLVLDAGRTVVDDTPGRALGSAWLEPIGLTPPTLVRLAEAAGLDPSAAFDREAIARALAGSRSGGGITLRSAPGQAAEETLDWQPATDSPARPTRHRGAGPPLPERRRGAPRRVAGVRAGRDGRDRRSERLGQDHAREAPQRTPPADRRAGHPRWRRCRRLGRPRARRNGRVRVPEPG